MAIQGIKPGLRGRGGQNVGIRFEGDWIKFNDLIRNFGPQTMAIANRAQQKFAEEYRDRVKVNIRTGGRRFGYPEHSRAYRDYKRTYGGPDRLLMWSGAMHDAVQVLEFRGHRVGVGITKGAQREPYHGKEGELLSIGEYANILEKGSPARGIPPRPVFSDTFSKDMGGLRGMRSFLQWHIIRGFANRGIRVTKR